MRLMVLFQRLRSLPKSLYVIGQLGLLGLPSLLFIPLLLRWVNVDAIATLLVAQVYVYYLVMVQQFGFNLMGPARLGFVGRAADRGVLASTLRFKAVLLLVNTFALGAIVHTVFDDAFTLMVFVGLLLSYMFNSNWYLQSHHDFYTGALSAGIGVAVGLVILVMIWQCKRNGIELSGVLAWAVLAMIAPQMMVGVGSFLGALRLAATDAEVVAWPAREIWAQGWPLMISQLVLLATTTLGTIVVSHVADSSVTAAYAATEKVFNLMATVVVALFSVHYPQLASRFRNDLFAYWREIWYANVRIAALGFFALLLNALAGEELFGIYLGQDLAALISPVLTPLALWLTLVPFQNALLCHFAIAGKTSRSIGVACLMLFVEIVVGLSLMTIDPLYWVYGMVAAQLPAALLLIKLYRSDMHLTEVG